MADQYPGNVSHIAMMRWQHLIIWVMQPLFKVFLYSNKQRRGGEMFAPLWSAGSARQLHYQAATALILAAEYYSRATAAAAIASPHPRRGDAPQSPQCVLESLRPRLPNSRSSRLAGACAQRHVARDLLGLRSHPEGTSPARGMPLQAAGSALSCHVRQHLFEAEDEQTVVGPACATLLMHR